MRLAWIAFVALFCAGGLSACGARPAAPEGAETVLSLRDAACASCGEGAIARLKTRADVYAVRFDRDKAELTVRYEPSKTQPDALASWVAREIEVETVVGAGKGRYAEISEWPADADMKNIAPQGEDVDIEAHLAPGKVTVFDFYADWCGPCRDVDLALQAIVGERADVAVRKLNMVSWETPVAKRYLKGVPELPYVVVYGADGEKVEAITGKDLPKLRAAIARGSKKDARGAEQK